MIIIVIIIRCSIHLLGGQNLVRHLQVIDGRLQTENLGLLFVAAPGAELVVSLLYFSTSFLRGAE